MTLASLNRATVTLRYEDPASQELTYSAAGSYSYSRKGLVMTVKGQWSHLGLAPAQHVLRFDVVDGGLARPGVGMECDASSTEYYAR